MKYFKILYGCVVLATIISGTAAARTVLQHRDGSYIAGKLAGRVDTIFNNLSLDIHNKKILLRQELAHAEQLKLPLLAEKITAMLALLVVQGRSLEPYVADVASAVRDDSDVESDIFDTPESVLAATLDGGEQAASDSSVEASSSDALTPHQISQFGTEVIERAAAYSDRLLIAGTPSVSSHRIATLGLFVRRIKADAELLARTQDAVKVCKKIYDLLATNVSLQKFVGGFKKHIQKKYAASVENIEGAINFKVFEVLVYYSGDEDQTAEEIVGDFLSSYNSYVTPQHIITPQEIDFPVRDWARTLLATDNVVKHIMLVLSFAMEEVKHDVRREPLAKQLYDDVQGQVSEALALLEEDGVSVSDTERAHPLELAQQCSHQVQALLSAEGAVFSPEQQARVERYVNVVDQISQLTSDYDMVVREMADTAAVSRLVHDISQLPESEQQILKDSSSLDPSVLQEIVPVFGDEQDAEGMEGSYDRMPRKRRSRMSTGAKVGIGLGVSAAILLVLWQGVTMQQALKSTQTARESFNKANASPDARIPKTITFWDMLTNPKTPLGKVTHLFESVKV